MHNYRRNNMGHAKYITSEAKSGLSPEEMAVLESKIKNLIEQIAELNGWRLEVKVEMALKNKLISPEQGEKLFGAVNSGSGLYDRYNKGERTETLLKELEEYLMLVQEGKNEIWGSMEIIERKSKDIERKPTNKKRKRLNNKKRPEDSPLKSPTELAADIADSQPATFKRGGQEFYTEASQPEDAGEEAQRRKSLAFLSEKNNSEDKNMETVNPDRKSGKEELNAKVLDGSSKTDLADSMEVFRKVEGLKIVVGTDKGITHKEHNEDRVVVDAKAGIVSVLDGVGGGKRGDEAAQIIAEAILENSEKNIESIIKISQEKMKESGIEGGGACLIYAKISANSAGQKFLEIAQSGDVKLFIVDKNGYVRFETRDETEGQDKVDRGELSKDELLCSDDGRAYITNCIQPNYGSLKKYPQTEFNKGERVIIMSDGVSDNLTPDEISEIAKDSTAEDLMVKVSEITNERMLNYSNIIKQSPDRLLKGIYSDGYKSKPKRDNRAIAIIDYELDEKAKLKEFLEKEQKETEIKQLLGPEKLTILEKFGKEFYNTLEGGADWEGHDQKKKQEVLRIQTEEFLAAALKEAIKEDGQAEKIVGYLIAKVESR